MADQPAAQPPTTRNTSTLAASAQNADRLTLTVPLDPYLSLHALSGYSGLSVRTLRGYLTGVAHPLPCYRVGGRVLVRRSEFDAWVRRYRCAGCSDIDRAVDEILRDLT